MNNLELAKQYEEYIVSLRRYFHEHPELSDHEENTIKKISEELDKMHIDYTIVEHGGIIASIKGHKDNHKSVLLRADVDALPINENNNNLLPNKRTCISKNKGVMHACGHDGHTAMLLGAAQILKDKKDEFEGTIYLCFERGEEATGNSKYLLSYIEQNNINIDTCFAIHLNAHSRSGFMGINDDAMLAGVMSFTIELEGLGGHGSRPDLTNNPIDCFVAIYNQLNAFKANKLNPFKVCTYSIGALNAGTLGNVIPQTLRFQGTMRTYDREVTGMKFYEEFKKIIDDTCALYNCKPHYIKYTKPGYATINDSKYANFARKVIAREIGDENVGYVEPWMGSESFAKYLVQWPGVFCFLGIKNEEKGTGADHHNELFDIDEDVLKYGSCSAVTYAIEYLNNQELKGHRKMSYKDVLINTGRLNDLEMLYK